MITRNIENNSDITSLGNDILGIKNDIAYIDKYDDIIWFDGNFRAYSLFVTIRRENVVSIHGITKIPFSWSNYGTINKHGDLSNKDNLLIYDMTSQKFLPIIKDGEHNRLTCEGEHWLMFWGIFEKS